MIKKLAPFLLLLACLSCNNYSPIKVIEVIDGDTVRLSNGKLLRYIGIDTPEVRIKEEDGFRYNPQPLAQEAKEFNRELTIGRTVEVEFDLEKADRYGRLLGYCFADGVFVNAKLIEEGYAVLYTFPPNVKYVDLFVELQRKARRQRKGLWGAYEAIDHSEACRFINQIRAVRGKVLSTYESAKCVFLNFGRNYKTDFTVVIFRNCLNFFNKKGINPVTFYKGKVIEVSGRIREYNGPEIIVNTPYEIEIIEPDHRP